MSKCPRCNTNETYEEFDFCEEFMNNMLLGGPQFVFIPDENFFKEIGVAKPEEFAGGHRVERIRLAEGGGRINPRS